MPSARQPRASQPSASQSGAGQPSAGQPSESYADPRLAALYDALNPADASTAFHLSLPGAPPARILDVGCGTGLLACEFAARGYDVTGVDPAAAMLATARARPGGDRVRWIQASAAGLDTGTGLAAGPRHRAGPRRELRLDHYDRARVPAAPGGPGRSRGTAGPGPPPGPGRPSRLRDQESGRTRVAGLESRGTPGSGWRRVGSPPTCTTTFARSRASWSPTRPGTSSPVPATRWWCRTRSGSSTSPRRPRSWPRRASTQVTWYGDWDRSPYGPASPEIIAVASGDRPASRGAVTRGGSPGRAWPRPPPLGLGQAVP